MINLLVSLLIGTIVTLSGLLTPPTQAEVDLARRITAETRGCSQDAMVAVAYISQRNTNWTRVPYWVQATAQALDVARNWRTYTDPAPDARYLWGSADFRWRAVRNLAARSRYVTSFTCSGGLQLHAYAPY